MDRREKWFHKGNYISSGLVVLLGLFLAIYAGTHYDYMDKYSLGPGFYPIWIGVLLVVVGLIMILQTKKGRFQEKQKKVPEIASVKRLLTFGVLAIMVLVLATELGMVITMVLFLFFMNLLIEKHSPLYSLVVGILTSAAIYVVFHMIFSINFPKGILGF
ncbi:tripartite tricarboxylate transporter TctB family protein [Hominifimenecus sp. rT4P-3]|uniref:tripartite tricarboxylate transporter TctB family protein n=1 Tax=Hominifimenecus sp. rT4P-3 TaxID=3242979 RepID=UPI003DA59B54